MATLQTTTFNDTGFITLPSGTTAQRPSPSTGMMRYNSTMDLLEWYNGTLWLPVTGYSAGTIGTGGQSIGFSNGGIVHQFTTTGNHTFTPAFTGTVKVLVVAGGGTGASSHGGGGGGGGIIFNRAFPVTSGTPYPITVGAGGASTAYGVQGNNGQDSVFSALTAIGGGGGGGWNNQSGRPGGSGGGGGTGDQDGSRYRFPGGYGTQGQGFPGGSGQRFNRQGENCHASGGGGGAGGIGRDSNDHHNQLYCPDGGEGLATDILGSVMYFGGGGGGGPHLNSGGGGNGGIGGGGGGAAHHGGPRKPGDFPLLYGRGGGRAINDGQPAPARNIGGNAGTNTGGGGGGGNGGGSNQTGGPGIVVIRY